MFGNNLIIDIATGIEYDIITYCGRVVNFRICSTAHQSGFGEWVHDDTSMNSNIESVNKGYRYCITVEEFTNLITSKAV